MITARLNHVVHDVSGEQQEKKFKETLAKYNEIIENTNDITSLMTDIAKALSNDELVMLRRAGIIQKQIGRATYILNGYLTIDAMIAGEPWAIHAYNTVLGVIGTEGSTTGAVISTAIDGSVTIGKMYYDAINWVNTAGSKNMMNHIRATSTTGMAF